MTQFNRIGLILLIGFIIGSLSISISASLVIDDDDDGDENEQSFSMQNQNGDVEFNEYLAIRHAEVM